jgi:hypothetical protein
MDGDTALVISVATGDTLFNLAGHGGSVLAIAYSANGKRIATGEVSEYLRAGLSDHTEDEQRVCRWVLEDI